MATTTDMQPPALHLADSHDLYSSTYSTWEITK
jgi:hypothetical protein